MATRFEHQDRPALDVSDAGWEDVLAVGEAASASVLVAGGVKGWARLAAEPVPRGLAGLPAMTVGRVDGAAPATLLAKIAALLDVVYAAEPGAGAVTARDGILVGDPDCVEERVAELVAAAARRPRAVASLVGALRATDAHATESLAYGMLLGSAEFAEWIGSTDEGRR